MIYLSIAMLRFFHTVISPRLINIYMNMYYCMYMYIAWKCTVYYDILHIKNTSIKMLMSCSVDW